MSDMSLRYEEIEPDRRSELRLLDQETLIEKVLEMESQILFDPKVLVDETAAMVETFEVRRRVIDFVKANHSDDDDFTQRRMIRDLLIFVNLVRP